MEAKEFKEQNCTYAENQKPYKPLPALKFDTPEGQVVSCWKLTKWERIKVLFTGVVWLCLWSFNKPLTPSLLSVNKKDMFES
jgi:hypothetical protein